MRKNAEKIDVDFRRTGTLKTLNILSIACMLKIEVQWCPERSKLTFTKRVYFNLTRRKPTHEYTDG